ncbi:PREDICTED: uncharacterized protein LOC106330806 [Brassica oleracea var. oleracea]|uniref:uncharacterized protein LOC106330806 n=1 Tax=Brassica oleracea var. oleracea TaxID=109376 RepID=UPI0006A73B7B|nr:PREDICTED: uncharacterized protein LOC106330806 [Brassica oleracea var. oleracea]
MGVYCLHHNSRIPFESAIRVFDDEAMGSYPWGRTAYEVLIDSIKTLAPQGGSYTISGMTVALLIWAYESVACFGENFGRVVNNEDVSLLRWGGKRTRASFDNLLAAEIKEHGEVRVRRMALKDSIEEMFPKWSGEPDDPQLGNAQGKGNEKKKKMKGGVSSEGEPPTKKQKKFESRVEAYELDQNRPLMDQKTIDDSVKALLEERLKVIRVGKILENNDNPSPPSADKSLTLASPRVQTQQKSVNSPALAATPGKVFGPKKNLAKELDKESGVKRTLAEEFGSVAKATDHDSQHVDFVLVSPSKDTKDDKDAKVPAYGRGCRGNRIFKGEEADEKKKAAQANVAFKRKEKAETKKKAVEAKKKDVEAKKKEVEGEKCSVTPKGFPKAAVSSPAVFPYVGENGTTCMRKNVTPSSVIYDPLAPVDPVLLEKLMQYIKGIPPKTPAPADKRAVLSADHEGDFYSILIHERPWPENEYGWVFDNGKLPEHCLTNLKWYEDVDHLYGCLQTGGNHWVAYHLDLKKEKIDCYDPIFGEATPETPSKKKFSLRRRSKRYTPQNTQIGDCGVYSLKFVECLALGVTFDGISDNNIQGLRMKMAAEILDEGGNTVMSSLMAN